MKKFFTKAVEKWKSLPWWVKYGFCCFMSFALGAALF